MKEIVSIGQFSIEYASEIDPTQLLLKVPLDVQVTLGHKKIGSKGTQYLSAGWNFSVEDYLEKAYDIWLGEQRTIEFDKKGKVPLHFAPQDGSRCLVYTRKSKNVEPQYVSIDRCVFDLVNVINDLLFDLDNNRQYEMLENTLNEAEPFFQPHIFGVLFNRNNKEMYKNNMNSNETSTAKGNSIYLF